MPAVGFGERERELGAQREGAAVGAVDGDGKREGIAAQPEHVVRWPAPAGAQRGEDGDGQAGVRQRRGEDELDGELVRAAQRGGGVGQRGGECYAVGAEAQRVAVQFIGRRFRIGHGRQVNRQATEGAVTAACGGEPFFERRRLAVAGVAEREVGAVLEEAIGQQVAAAPG